SWASLGLFMPLPLSPFPCPCRASPSDPQAQRKPVRHVPDAPDEPNAPTGPEHENGRRCLDVGERLAIGFPVQRVLTDTMLVEVFDTGEVLAARRTQVRRACGAGPTKLQDGHRLEAAERLNTMPAQLRATCPRRDRARGARYAPTPDNPSRP